MPLLTVEKIRERRQREQQQSEPVHPAAEESHHQRVEREQRPERYVRLQRPPRPQPAAEHLAVARVVFGDGRELERAPAVAVNLHVEFTPTDVRAVRPAATVEFLDDALDELDALDAPLGPIADFV